MSRPASRPVFDVAKRLGDVTLSLILLTVTAPVQLVVAALVRNGLGSPVLFRHPRLGKNAAEFTLYKFRTMRPVDERRGWVTDADRLTPLGKRLRALSLDELPTLWNVLRGDMSIVGPRPLLVEYRDLYTPAQARRHEVRPGITGLAQVNGRNELSWEQKFEFDVSYVERRAPGLDVSILLRTVGTVLSRRGISQNGQATVAKFGGNDGS